MADFLLTDATPIMKQVYLPPVREALYNATPLLKFVEKETQEIPGGSDFIIPLHVGRNDSAGDGRGENVTLPTAGKQTFNRTFTAPKYLYGSLKVSGPVIAATKSNKGAFLKALESEMKYLMIDMKRAFNRQLHGDGRDVIAYWISGTATTANAVVVADGFGNRFDHLNRTTALDLINGSTHAVRVANISVTRGALTTGGRFVTVDTALTGATAGDYFVKASTLGKQMMGIAGIVSPNDPNAVLYANGLQRLTVASEPEWASQVIYADGGSSEITNYTATATTGRVDISFEAIQDLLTAISVGSDYSEDDVNLMLTSPGLRNKYVQLCRNERVFTNTFKLDGGFEAVGYNKKPIVADAQSQRNRLYALVTESLMLAKLADLDWIDVGGDVLYRLSGGDIDGVGARLYVYQEFAAKMRNCNGVIVNLNE
jgi:hypothetical protein